jgi:hypothetical protein
VVPFFSSIYRYDNCNYLTRGEDTVMGLNLKLADRIKAIDIDVKIRHDTYGHFPEIPDIYSDVSIRDRIYFASVGWIGRNPFMHWVTGADVEAMYLKQFKNMRLIESDFAHHLGDERFANLSEAIEISYDRLEEMIVQYETFVMNWDRIITRLERRGVY